MARADVHIFGSVSGYGTTAASAGVTESEKRELGSFQFGEAATADAIARLEHHAVMTGRPLASGRFAISRMLPAGVDDAGRPTIEVISLLLSASGYESCAGSMQMLASDVGLWRRARTEVSAGIEIPAANSAGDPEDLASLRAFDLWIAATRSGGVGVMSESESPTVLAMVCTLHQRDRAQCRWGVGMLSISAPVDIASLASGTSTLGARAVIRAAKNGAWHCEETECAQVLATSGGKAFAALDELVEHVRPHLPELQDSRRYAHETGPSSSTREHRVTLAAIGSAVLSSLALALGLIVWTSSGRPPVVVVPPSAPSDDVSDVGTASARDSGSAYGAVGPTPVPAVDPQKSVESATVEQSLEQSKELPADASTVTEVPATSQAAPELVKLVDLVTVTWYADDDGDKFGDPQKPRSFSEVEEKVGYVDNSGDKCPKNSTKWEVGECGCEFDQACDVELAKAVAELGKMSNDLRAIGAEVTALVPPKREQRPGRTPSDEPVQLPSFDLSDSIRYLDDLKSRYRRFAETGERLFQLDARLRANDPAACPAARFIFFKPKDKLSLAKAYPSLDTAWQEALSAMTDIVNSFEAQLVGLKELKVYPPGDEKAANAWPGLCEAGFEKAQKFHLSDDGTKPSESDKLLYPRLKDILEDDWIVKQLKEVATRIQTRASASQSQKP